MLIIIQYHYVLNNFGLGKLIKNQAKTLQKSFQIPTCILDALGDAFLDHFGLDFRPSCTKLAPNWPQVGPKLAPSWPQVGPKFAQVGPKLGHESDLGAILAPKHPPGTPMETPGTPQGPPGDPPGPPGTPPGP